MTTAAKITVRVTKESIKCELPHGIRRARDGEKATAGYVGGTSYVLRAAIGTFMGNGTEERLRQLHEDAQGEVPVMMPSLLWLLGQRLNEAKKVAPHLPLDVEVVRGEFRKVEPAKKPGWEWPFGKGSTNRDYSHIQAPKIPTGDGAPPLE